MGGHRWTRAQAVRARRPPCWFRVNVNGPAKADRVGDVLESNFAGIDEVESGLVPDLLVRCGRQRDATWLRLAFQPRGNVDVIAVDVAIVEHDVSEMQADAKGNARLCRTVCRGRGNRTLNIGSSLGCGNDGAEQHQHAITRQLDDLTAGFR